MNLATLDMDVERAKAGLDEYTRSLREHPKSVTRAEDAAIAAAYRAAAKGLPLISLPRAVVLAGWFDTGLPRIAIARADATAVWVHWSGNTTQLTYADDPWATSRGAIVGEHTVLVQIDAADRARTINRWHGRTRVPLVPPRHRRRGWQRLHVLWEVEQWDPTPPRDPALLRHLRGDLWAVLATWDLTDIERHVLSQRREP